MTNKQTKVVRVQGVVWNCAMTEFSAQCVRVHRKASEMYQRYAERLRRCIRDTSEHGAGRTLTDSNYAHINPQNFCPVFSMEQLMASL